MKKAILLFLAAIMVFSLCACGSEKTLTVDYIRYSPSPVKGGESFYLVGTQKEVRPVYVSGYVVSKVFKDCTVESMQVGENGTFQYKSDGSGGYQIDTYITLTVKDADGKTHSVKIDSGTVIKLDKDSGELLLPED